jgi:hypothetical protein
MSQCHSREEEKVSDIPSFTLADSLHELAVTLRSRSFSSSLGPARESKEKELFAKMGVGQEISVQFKEVIAEGRSERRACH